MSGPQPGTPTPWEVDTIQSEGEYGVGPDTVAGFAVSAICDAQGKVLFDALTSDAMEVHEDYADEDGFCSAWDATSAANAAAIVHRMNNWDAVVEALSLAVPTNVCLTNTHWPDSTIVPLDVPLGDLRKIAAALTLAKSGGNS